MILAQDLPEEVKKTLNVKSFGVGHGVQLLRLKGQLDKQLQFASEFADSVTVGKTLTVKKVRARARLTVGESCALRRMYGLVC